MKSVPVLIAGGGPVGMTLACELSRRGIACMLVERNATTTSYPKMDITNARSMELFRRLGLVEALRAVAVPEDNNFDVSWVTSLIGHELHRFRYPSVKEWRRLIREQNDGSMPGEPPMRVSQVEIEPVLQRAVQAAPNVEARWGVAFEALAQDADGVTVTLRTADGATEQVRCRYLAGCDGGGSEVRHALGIKLDGEARVMDRFLIHFRSTAHDVLQHFGVAWHYQSPKGTLIAQNDDDIWSLQARFPQDTAPESIDAGAMLRDFAGCDFEHEILLTSRWYPHFLVAEKYGQGRVLAGRRRRAPIRADRRLRHEHRHRRRLRSRLDARRRAARFRRAGAARVLPGRAAAGGPAQLRGGAPPQRHAARHGRGLSRGAAGRRRRRERPARGRAADRCAGQRRERKLWHRIWLQLREFAGDLRRARCGHSERSVALPAEHVSGRADAERGAARRHADLRPAGIVVHAWSAPAPRRARR